jgi:hypothetical protein
MHNDHPEEVWEEQGSRDEQVLHHKKNPVERQNSVVLRVDYVVR